MSPQKQKEYLYELIRDTEKDLINCMVQEYIYQKEAADPKHISKSQAESNVATYQTRIKSLQQHIEIYKLYMKEKL